MDITFNIDMPLTTELLDFLLVLFRPTELKPFTSFSKKTITIKGGKPISLKKLEVLTLNLNLRNLRKLLSSNFLILKIFLI